MTLSSAPHAERYITALTCYQRRDTWIDPVWITHEGRRALFVTGSILGQRGRLHPVPRYGDPGEIRRAVHTNAGIVVDAVSRTGIWDVAGDPWDEIRWCLSVCTLPVHGDHHAAILRSLFEKQQQMIELQDEMQMLLREVA
ncbi:hypothetical protein [Planctomicrobium sp. SH664]|uniref:hypothetical protein n=1 Tax=Planctomicrobium sp. SH664 TaxID=3448125 RepID=UPI003F5C2621